MSRAPLSAILALLALSAVTAGCGKSQGPQPAAQQGRAEVRFPVEVQIVAASRVEYAVSAVGSVEAFERVEVTARVGGVVEQVRFAEGDLVGSDRVLVDIEPDRYRLAVESARATLGKAEASLAEARSGLARRESVNAKNPDLVRAEDVEAWRTRVHVANAEVAQARAALELAELNLRDALVRASVPGVIQTRSVQTGQYVQPGAVLATLLRREPLLLRFKVPEQDAARLRPGMVARFTVREAASPYTSTLSHVADSAAEDSRMVDVTARIDDPRRGELRPGAFAQVVVPVGDASEAPVVPQTAIRPSERGFLAFVVEDGVARERILALGMRTAAGLVEVRDGLRVGDRLVVRGAEALRDGAKVREGETAPAPAASPAAAATDAPAATPGRP